MKALYTAVVTTAGGRNGSLKSSDGTLDLELRTPKEMGGQGGAHTNPEQLFAAGYAACLASAMAAVAGQRKIMVSPRITASVTLWSDEATGFRLSVDMDVVFTGVDLETAREIAEGGNLMCPYSKATKGNIDFTMKVSVK